MRSQKEVAIWLDTVMDNDVRLAISHGERPPMISPFVPSQITKDQYGQKVISYGLSSYGYDLRCSREFKIFTNAYSGRLDAKSPDPSSCLSHTGDFCIVPPGGLVLTNTVEKFHIPRDIMTVVLGKSTYARLGLVCNTTPAEPGWTGYLTLEFSNTSPLPIKLYAGEGCAQMLFFEGEYDATINYADREGKYMDQENQPVHARMK
jgi:dCTP deaminase